MSQYLEFLRYVIDEQDVKINILQGKATDTIIVAHFLIKFSRGENYFM